MTLKHTLLASALLSLLLAGAPVTVELMGEDGALRGHVASIAGGIGETGRSDASNLLANVNPTFSWVRLAQRIPVRISLDGGTSDPRLVSGRTATVSIAPAAGGGCSMVGRLEMTQSW